MRKLILLIVGASVLFACSPDSGNGFRLVASGGGQNPTPSIAGAIASGVVPTPSAPVSEVELETEPLIETGYLRLRLGDLDGAVEAFTAHLEEEGENVSAYLGRGRAQIEAGELEKAIDDFSKAIALDSDRPEAYEERADALTSAGRLEEALEDYGELARLRPGDAVAYRQRAWVYLQLGRPDLVAREIDRAGALFGKEAVDHYILGLAQFELKNYDEALASQSRALDSSREEELGNEFSAVVLSSRGETYYQLKNYERAYDDYARALQLGGPNAMVYELRAMVFYEQEQYADAAADHLRAIQVEPNNAVLYNNLADSRMLEGSLDSALQNIDTALRLDPDLGIAHYTKGEVLEKLGRLEDAAASFDRAAEHGFVLESAEPAE